MGAGTGILLHSIAAALGLAIAIQTSAIGFLAFKFVGALYLIWLGIRMLVFRNLVSFAPAARRPLHMIYLSGLTSNMLNPKIALFVLAFIPQFVNADRGSVTMQMMVYGAWLAAIAAVGLATIGSFASVLSNWLLSRPRVTAGINIATGLTFVTAGLSAAAIEYD